VHTIHTQTRLLHTIRWDQSVGPLPLRGPPKWSEWPISEVSDGSEPSFFGPLFGEM